MFFGSTVVCVKSQFHLDDNAVLMSQNINSFQLLKIQQQTF